VCDIGCIRNYKLPSFPSKYTTVFVLLDISESKCVLSLTSSAVDRGFEPRCVLSLTSSAVDRGFEPGCVLSLTSSAVDRGFEPGCVLSLTSSAVDRGFEPRWGKSKDYKTSI
jgi:hypothetical protein